MLAWYSSITHRIHNLSSHMWFCSSE